MPANKRTAVGSGGSSSSGVASPESVQEDDEAYRLKRKRNNDAVKKTREKLKQTAATRKQHVEELKKENDNLRTQIKTEKKNLTFLKSLLLTGVKPENHERVIKEILEASTDDEDDK